MFSKADKFFVTVAGAVADYLATVHSASHLTEALILAATAALVYLVPNKAVAK